MNDQGALTPRESPTRTEIMRAANSLFYRFGFQAVGVDRLSEESGVAKMTLYRHFSSKDDLIVEYLNAASAEFWTWFEEAAASTEDPIAKLLSIYDRLEDRCRSARFVGCTFQSAAAEFPDRDHPANKVARDHKEKLRARIEALLDEGGIDEVRSAANQLMLVMEGALASARVLSLPVPAREAGAAARAIVERQERV